MKDGWIVKKLGEVCEITMGQSPSSESYNDKKEGLPFFQGCSDFGKMNPNVTTYCNAPKKMAEVNDILLSVRAPIGTLNIANLYCCIGRGLASIRGIKNVSLYKYVFYYLIKSKKQLQDLGTGATFKAIGKDTLVNFPIPIPPLPEQSRIVAELDQLSNIIEKKRQQLSELDNLAQSIFYDMFGDPVVNEKGWVVKKLGDVCVPKSKIKRANKHYLPKDQIRYIDISSIDNSRNTINHTNIMQFEDAPSRAQQIVIIGDILVSLVRPNLKNIALVNNDYDDLVASTGFCVLRTLGVINHYYLLYCVLEENFTNYLMERTSGANYPAVREEDIKGYDLCIPPLLLQQLFAQKIEAIESEKALIKQSIAETEELFNSRMDYYFG